MLILAERTTRKTGRGKRKISVSRLLDLSVPRFNQRNQFWGKLPLKEMTMRLLHLLLFLFFSVTKKGLRSRVSETVMSKGFMGFIKIPEWVWNFFRSCPNIVLALISSGLLQLFVQMTFKMCTSNKLNMHIKTKWHTCWRKLETLWKILDTDLWRLLKTRQNVSKKWREKISGTTHVV